MAQAQQMRLFPAAAPELVRCNQKDRFYMDHLTSLLSEVSRQVLPLRLWLRWQRELQLLAELGYCGLTTLLGNQTLGEEYCNIIQVGPAVDGRHTPAGLLQRLLPVAMQTVGVYVLEKALEMLYKKLRERDLHSLRLSEREYELLEKIVGCAEDFVTSLGRLHLALFYLHGLFYHVGKRVAGVKYLMIRYGSALSQAPAMNTYRVLGWLILVQLAIQALKLCYKVVEWYSKKQPRQKSVEGKFSVDEEGLAEVQSPFKCPLCLEPCKSQTATVCGHIFCWACICEWTSERTECPVCRSAVQPQQLICLQHFSI